MEIFYHTTYDIHCSAFLSDVDCMEYHVDLSPLRLTIEDKLIKVPPEFREWLMRGRMRNLSDNDTYEIDNCCQSTMFDHLWQHCDRAGCSARRMFYKIDRDKLLSEIGLNVTASSLKKYSNGMTLSDCDISRPKFDKTNSNRHSLLSRLIVDVVERNRDEKYIYYYNAKPEANIYSQKQIDENDSHENKCGSLLEIRFCAWIPPHYHLLIILIVGECDEGDNMNSNDFKHGENDSSTRGSAVLVRACTDCNPLFLDGHFDRYLSDLLPSAASEGSSN